MKTVRVKAIRNILAAPENPNDVSPEACRKRTMAPSSVFEVSESSAAKLTGSGAAEETTQKLSTPEELEDLRVYHEQYLRKVEEARLKRIASENE